MKAVIIGCILYGFLPLIGLGCILAVFVAVAFARFYRAHYPKPRCDVPLHEVGQ